MSQPPRKKRRTTPTLKASNTQKTPDTNDMKAMIKDVFKEFVPTIVDSVISKIKNPTNADHEPTVAEEVVAVPVEQETTEAVASTSTNNNIRGNKIGPMHVGRRAGHNVDSKIKSKIFAEEYIQLPSLLFKSQQMRLEAVKDSDNSISFVQKEQKMFFKSFNQWVEAFHIFVAIYCSNRPEESPNLMRYMQIIQKLATDIGEKAALYYDEQFRMWRSENPESMPWNVINQELHSEAIQIGVKARLDGQNKGKPYQQLFRAKTEKRNVKTGFCFSFNNNNGKCRRRLCTYPHVCSKCSHDHPRNECPMPNDGQEQVKPPPAKPAAKK